MSDTTTNRPRRKTVALWITGFVIILSGIAGASAFHHFNASADQRPRSGRVSRERTRPTHVYALGRLEPAGTVLKISPRSGNDGTRVERLLVREGDDVEAGGVVAVLDNESLRQAALAEAEARHMLTQVRLDQVKAGAKAGDIAAQQLAVELNSEQVRVAERELKRARELHTKNAMTIEQLEAKQWAVDRAMLEHRRSEELLKSLREVRDIDVRVAERDVAAAAASVRRAQVDLEAAQVRAPAAGRVLKVLIHEGERVGDQGMLELGDVLHMEAVAEIFEADVVDVKCGQQAVLKVDGLIDPIDGEVVDVGHRVGRKVVLTNDPVSDTDARVVEVRIRIASDKIERVVRMSNARVEVDITVQHESQ